ncbi:hypothetical protein FACS189432_09760 [Bacteroidia bacterium]|nr:hypothetical protein FACS189432_09760 [Bacteroidia bacterium]
MKLYPKLILEALEKVRYPGTGKSIVEMGMIADDMRIEENKVSFSIVFEKPNDPFIKSVVKAAEIKIGLFQENWFRRRSDAYPKTFAEVWFQEYQSC